MARPEIDDDVIHKLEKIIDSVNDIPLPADELSVNQQFLLVVDSLQQEVQNKGSNEAMYLFYDPDEDPKSYSYDDPRKGKNVHRD